MNNRTGPFVAMGVLLVALVLAVVDTGKPAAPPATPSWAAAVEAGEDHVTPEALAALLLESPEQVLIVDVRLPGEFAAFHIPGSVNLNLVELLGPQGEDVLDAAEDKIVVLVSNGMTHPAQAWVALTQSGRANVRILEDGLAGFRSRVLAPPSLRGATTERRARAEGVKYAALRSRFDSERR